jgi:hypothetical protein
MKRISLVTCMLVCCLSLVSAYGQEGPKGASAGRDGKAGASAARPDARPAARAAFTGSVVAVDVGAATFSLKERGSVVGFDASSPALTGYSTLSDMRVGDKVKVSYTATGIEVTKLGARRERPEKKEAAVEPQPPQARPAEKPTKWVKKLPRRAKKSSGEDFDDVDLKKDGKITPVELSIVIKDLTMDQFRKYDKKHRGYLDKQEFQEAVKDYRLGKAQ